jgi:hypothetical protein
LMLGKAVDEATKITLKYRYIDLLLRDWTDHENLISTFGLLTGIALFGSIVKDIL